MKGLRNKALFRLFFAEKLNKIFIANLIHLCSNSFLSEILHTTNQQPTEKDIMLTSASCMMGEWIQLREKMEIEKRRIKKAVPKQTPWGYANVVFDQLVEKYTGETVNRTRLFERHDSFLVEGIKKAIEKFNSTWTVSELKSLTQDFIKFIKEVFDKYQEKGFSVKNRSRNFRQCAIMYASAECGKPVLTSNIIDKWIKLE